VKFPISRAEINLVLMASGVKYAKLEACLKWAFGEANVPIKDWKDSWNEKHKDIFEMKGEQTLFDSIYQIGAAFSSEQIQNDGAQHES